MQEKVTSFDIAALAGVSQPTVSRALRDDPTVSERTRQRVRAIAHRLHYTVDKNASSLRRGQSRTLALLFFEDPTPDDSAVNPFFLSMLGSILRACAVRSYDLLTSFQRASAEWHVDYADSRKADGLILLGYGKFDQYRRRVDQLVEQGTRFVRWGSSPVGDEDIAIGSDNLLGGVLAGRRLLDQGRRRIAFLGTATDQYPEFRDRRDGFTVALAERGLTLDPALVRPALSIEEDGYRAVRQLIAGGYRFDAIFAASDMIAIGAMRALHEAGIGVPDAVSVVGFDDVPAAAMTSPPLTTIAQDYTVAGELLVETLVARIENRPVTPGLLPPRLVVRGSG